MMEHNHFHNHDHDHHSTVVAVGCIKFSHSVYAVDRENIFESGSLCTFGVELIEGASIPTCGWIEDDMNNKLCDSIIGKGHKDHWHFSVTPSEFVGIPTRFALQVDDEISYVNIYNNAKPSHGGILTILMQSNATIGFLEIKLHDDKGDIEVWLLDDDNPIDIPLESNLNIHFPRHNKSIYMTIRNSIENEDEDGIANIRDNKTNYFIFPGETGQDPEWLMGESFRETVVVSVDLMTSEKFILVPHSIL